MKTLSLLYYLFKTEEKERKLNYYGKNRIHKFF